MIAEPSVALRREPTTPPSPAVSVIVIFLDAEKFLAEAIESVLAQEFSDWELVLVDDGSSDQSLQIARGYAGREPGRIRCVQHPGGGNRGMSASRNRGIAESTAPLIAFLDADDTWMPDKLAGQVALMAAQPRAEMVFGHTTYWYSWTGKPEDARRDYVRRRREQCDVLIRPPFLVTDMIMDGRWSHPIMSNIMLRRESLARTGGFEESFRQTPEDTVFLVKFFLNCCAYYADACWDRYRQHPDSCMATLARQRRLNEVNLAFLRWTKAYFADQGVTDPYLLRAVNDNLRLRAHPVLGRLHPRYLTRKSRQLGARWLGRAVPADAREGLRQRYFAARKPWLFLVRWLRLRRVWRVTPVHPEFGWSYGTSVDRHYIEGFLDRHRQDIGGCVLEIGDATYTQRFGGHRVTRSEVLHAIPGNPAATIVADLTNAPAIASNQFDCIIFTQTLQCIYDFRAALATLHRILKPNGVLLVTIPGVAHQISRAERPYWGDFWRWTTMSTERMFGEVFPPGFVQIRARGNVLTCIAILHGLVVEELRPGDFAYDDPEYELSIGIRAVKPPVDA